jgi:hypothetical protein
VIEEVKARPGTALCRQIAAVPEADLGTMVTVAADLIANQTFEFGPRRAVRIPKIGGGGFRTLKVSDSVVDKIVDRWLLRVLKPWLPRTPERNPLASVRQVQRWGREGYRCLRRFDFRDYYDHIDIELLLAQLEASPVPRHLVRLARAYLAAPTIQPGERLAKAQGLPQGGSVSTLLGHVYTWPLRQAVASEGDVKFVLFTDDGLIMAKRSDRLANAEAAGEAAARKLRLPLHPTKNWRGSIYVGVSFLGFKIRPSDLDVGQERLDRFRSRLKRQVRAARTIGEAIARVNNVLSTEFTVGYSKVSWLRYYSHAKSDAPFKLLDRVVRSSIRGKYGTSYSNRRLTALGLTSVFLRVQQLRHERRSSRRCEGVRTVFEPRGPLESAAALAVGSAP